MKLVFGVNWRDTGKRGSHYKVVDNRGLVADYVETVPDSILLTREQFNELVEDIARKFQLSSVNNPSQFAQQYLSSLNSKENE